MDSEEDVYHFNPERTYQGLALVIVNFTAGRRKREGADTDLKYMKKTFKRLGFKVECHENVEIPLLVSLLREFSSGSRKEELKQYGCFVFSISSHGMEYEDVDKSKGTIVHHHAIEMFDGEYIYTRNILDHFSDRNCKALKNKPKLFFIQACRIPDSKSTQDHRDAGVGFDSGVSTHRETDRQGRGLSRDQTDYSGASRDTESDSEEEENVSDTDLEEDESTDAETEATAIGQGEVEDVLHNLERRQTEILRNLKRLKEQAWLIGREYLRAANQIKESNAMTAANQNEESSLQTGPNYEDAPTGIENQEDDIDAKGCRLVSADKMGPGDDIDPARARRKMPPVEFTMVPCHNDMLIMYASPQGYYAIRNRTEGSYMVRLLYEAVEKFYRNGIYTSNQINILDVLRHVSNQMAGMKFMGDKEYTIVPCIVHKLRKDVIFSHGKNMKSSKFSIKLSEISSSFGISFFTWFN